MKHQYAGDVGDLSKFVLLRDLRTKANVGVIWYLTPDEKSGRAMKDGRFTQFAHLSPDRSLVSELETVSAGERSITAIRQAGLLDGITDFDEFVPAHANRPDWFVRARRHISRCDVVFLDPDNGLATPALRRKQARSAKFVFPEELEALHSDGKTVICYQHAARQGTFQEQLRGRLKQFHGSFALRWHPLQARAYIVWPAKDRERWEQWADSILTGPWGAHFSLSTN